MEAKMPRCDRLDCKSEAIGVMGADIFPPKAVMDYYKTDRCITRMLVGVNVCQAHFDTLTLSEVFTEESLETMLEFVQTQTGTAVDKDATKLVLIPYTDKLYKSFMESDNG
jgi:hypothetical protein